MQTILGHYKEAEEELVTIQSAKYRSEYNYIECLTRCRKHMGIQDEWKLKNMLQTVSFLSGDES